jgi:hypothetical protein
MAKKETPQDKRDSGKPGGGAGRRDEVKGSPVWPGTGPYPPGDAAVKMGGEWGTNEPKGYDESGTSEIFYFPVEIEKDEQKNEEKKPNGKK